MSIIKTALVAASFVVVAAAANAQGREDLNSGFHGNTPAVQSYQAAPYAVHARDARGSYAQVHNHRARTHVPVQQYYAPVPENDANPLVDNFHGNS